MLGMYNQYIKNASHKYVYCSVTHSGGIRAYTTTYGIRHGQIRIQASRRSQIGIFAVLGGGSIAAVHASIIGDFGIGYQAGKNQAYSDWNGGYSQNDSCPGGNTISYCSGYVVGYDTEWGTLQQAQP